MKFWLLLWLNSTAGLRTVGGGSWGEGALCWRKTAVEGSLLDRIIEQNLEHKAEQEVLPFLSRWKQNKTVSRSEQMILSQNVFCFVFLKVKSTKTKWCETTSDSGNVQFSSSSFFFLNTINGLRIVFFPHLTLQDSHPEQIWKEKRK